MEVRVLMNCRLTSALDVNSDQVARPSGLNHGEKAAGTYRRGIWADTGDSLDALHKRYNSQSCRYRNQKSWKVHPVA
jgi:hypothetical protein